MYDNCPKCGHPGASGSEQASTSCAACGLIFAKYRDAHAGRPAAARMQEAEAAPERPGLLERLLQAPEGASGLDFYGRLIAYIFFLVWGWRLYAMDLSEAEINNSFMHLVVLPIHEAGHVLFIPLGKFMTILGGSLFQVLLPLILMASFVYGFGGSRRDNFAAALMLWWAAMAIIDVAPYIWDAYDPKMMLLGGKTGAESDGHDWQNILGDLGLIGRAHLIAGIAHTLGLIVMLAAGAWGGALLYFQYRDRGGAAHQS